MAHIAICKADTTDATEACRVLRRSISEVCGSDYGNDPKILAEWLFNKTPHNVSSWIQDQANFCVVAKRQDEIVGFAVLRGDEILLNYVVPEYLSKGAGHMMLEALERRAMVKV